MLVKASPDSTIWVWARYIKWDQRMDGGCWVLKKNLAIVLHVILEQEHPNHTPVMIFSCGGIGWIWNGGLELENSGSLMVESCS